MAHSYAEGVGDKLAHGLVNTVTGIGEIPKNIMLTTDQKGVGYGVTVGLLTGIDTRLSKTDFVRCRNITLGYAFNPATLNKYFKGSTSFRCIFSGSPPTL